MPPGSGPSTAERRRARHAGLVAWSPLLVQAATLCGAGLVLGSAVQAALALTRLRFTAALLGAQPGSAWRVGLEDALALALPLLALLAITAAAATMVQTGGVVALRRLLGSSEELSGGGEPTTSETLGRSLARLVTAALVLSAVVVLLARSGPELVPSIGSAARAGALVESLAGPVLALVCAILLLSGAVDLALAHRAWAKQLSRSPRDARREREREAGLPVHRQARARARDWLLAPSLRQQLGHAKLLVVWPGRVAIALAFDPPLDPTPRAARLTTAPRSTLIARGAETTEVIRLALALRVPVVHDPALAARLHLRPVGAAIAEGLYERVARLMTRREE